MLMCFPKIYVVFCDRAARSWLARGVPRPQIVMAGVSDSKTSDLNYEARVPKKSRQVVAGVWGSKTPDLNYEARVPPGHGWRVTFQDPRSQLSSAVAEEEQNSFDDSC